MNISMIVLNDFTHDARVRKEAESLTRNGNRVTINALWKPGLAEEETQSDIKIIRFRQHAREGRHMPGLAWLELLVHLPNRIARQKPEIIHAHDLNGLMLAYPAARSCKAHLIYDSHELEIERNIGGSTRGKWNKRLVKTIEGFLIHRVDAVITVSPSIAKHLAAHYQIDAPWIVHNCPPLLREMPEGKLRQQLNVPTSQPLILYQGGLLAGRGLRTLLEAMIHLPEIPLATIGSGPMLKQMKEVALRLGIQERVHFLGEIPNHELLNYTCDADLGTCLIENICLSYYYALPNKLFEYLMVGVPVLASDFPDLRQVIIDSKAGRVTDPTDPLKIAAEIKELLDHPDDLNAMRNHARQVSIERYNWQVEEQTLFKAYLKASGKLS